ncbi:MAG: EVE domain-containing protein [Nitrososphaerales archaeon]|nr:EVE domain-containing protein [Nitrososphaerales archaeon]
MEVRFVRKLREGLLNLSAPDYGKINVAVAYVKETGLDVLESMKVKVDRGVVGDAFAITQPKALERLMKGGSNIRMAQVVSGTFHPKLYMVPYDDSLGAIVGSANLTGGGLEANEEASIALRGHTDEAPIPNLLEYFGDLWNSSSVTMDRLWLDQYKRDYPLRGGRVDENRGTSVITDVSIKVARQQIERAARHWIVITTPKNYRICLASGLWGVNRQTRTIQEVRVGDIITFYIAGAMQFSGVYRATSEPFEDRTPLWPDKPYPWRVRIEPLNQVGRIHAPEIKDRLSLIGDPKHWGTFLQGEMKHASTADFRVLLSEMRRRAITRT